MTYLAVTFATVAVLWLPVLYAAVTAPEGWEDESGFHYRSGVSYNHDSAGAA